MAKSKQQKQEEALMRKRQNYNVQLERWRDWAPTGAYFADYVKRYGVEAAEKRKAQADAIWSKYLQEAKLDIYGNAISTIILPRVIFKGYTDSCTCCTES